LTLRKSGREGGAWVGGGGIPGGSLRFRVGVVVELPLLVLLAGVVGFVVTVGFDVVG